MKHLLVTNDFPPKVGGIQSYLWELWRRLPPDEVAVLTTSYPGDREFDAAQPFLVERVQARTLLPTKALRRRVEELAHRTGAQLIVLDPALPLGMLGRSLDLPYAVMAHGAEITVPSRLPITRQALRRVLSRAALVIAAGEYPAAEVRRLTRQRVPVIPVPPGVDVDRFQPLERAERVAARQRFGLPVDAPLVLSVSRLVPRKGMDVLIRAGARVASRYPNVCIAIAGAGRDRRRLEQVAHKTGSPVRFLGRVPESDLPALYACADVFAMICRSRWAGLEQEGFGIVFLEAAACGVPQVAGDSGGAAEAVIDGQTGLVVTQPRDAEAVGAAIERLLGSEAVRSQMGIAARRRAENEFEYERLATRLAMGLQGALRPVRKSDKED